MKSCLESFFHFTLCDLYHFCRDITPSLVCSQSVEGSTKCGLNYNDTHGLYSYTTEIKWVITFRARYYTVNCMECQLPACNVHNDFQTSILFAHVRNSWLCLYNL